MKKCKKIIGASIVTLVILGFYFFFGSSEGWRKYYVSIQYEGFVTGKFYDSNNKGLGTVMINDTGKYVILNDRIFSRIRIGDYVIKKEGTTEHTLVSCVDTIKFYPTDLDDRVIK